MHNFLRKGLFAAIVLAFALPLSVRAQSGDNDGCSNATLKGDYGFVITGQVFTAAGVLLRNGVAMQHFKGDGTFTQVDFVMNTPPSGVSAPVPTPPPYVDPVTGFHTGEQGSYTVNQDCTGQGELDFPLIGSGGAIIQFRFVLTNHGRQVHEVVYSVTPPAGTPAVLGESILAEGSKLGSLIKPDDGGDGDDHDDSH